MLTAYKWQRRVFTVLAVGLVGACGFFAPNPDGSLPLATRTPPAKASTAVFESSEDVATKGSALVLPADSEGIRVYRAARNHKGAKILVSTENRWLWYVSGNDTLISAPVAVGQGNNFEFNGKKWKFTTPRGKRYVVKKEENPIWTVPLWHYYEKASHRGLDAVHTKEGEKYALEDGTWIEIRDNEVGRVNKFGNFWPFTPGIEIIFDGKIFIPPVGTPQRRVPDALGPYKLDTGDGYLIHGTNPYNKDSIGLPASHGCVRMHNVDLERLYSMVEEKTPVFIF